MAASKKDAPPTLGPYVAKLVMYFVLFLLMAGLSKVLEWLGWL